MRARPPVAYRLRPAARGCRLGAQACAPAGCAAAAPTALRSGGFESGSPLHCRAAGGLQSRETRGTGRDGEQNFALLQRRALASSSRAQRSPRRAPPKTDGGPPAAARRNAAVDRLTSNIHDISDMSPHVLTAAATAAAKSGMKGHWTACVSRAFELRKGLSVRDAALLFSAATRMRAQDGRFLDMLAGVILAKFQRAREQQALQEQLRDQRWRQRAQGAWAPESPRGDSGLRSTTPAADGRLPPSSPPAPASDPAIWQGESFGAVSISAAASSRALSPSQGCTLSDQEPGSRSRSAASLSPSRSSFPPAPSATGTLTPQARKAESPIAAAFSPFAVYSVAVSCATLRYFNEELLTALAACATHVPLSSFSGFDLVGLLAAFASLRFLPPETFLRQAHALLRDEMRQWSSALQRRYPLPPQRTEAADSPASGAHRGASPHGASVEAPPPRAFPSGKKEIRAHPRRECPSSGDPEEAAFAPARSASTSSHTGSRGLALGRELPLEDAVTHGNLPERQTVNLAAVLHSMARFAELSDGAAARGSRSRRETDVEGKSIHSDSKKHIREHGTADGGERSEFFKDCLTLIQDHLHIHLRHLPASIDRRQPVPAFLAGSGSLTAFQKLDSDAGAHAASVEPHLLAACPRYNFAFSLTSLRDLSVIASVLNFLPSLACCASVRWHPSRPASSVVHAILDDLAILAPRIVERSAQRETASGAIGFNARESNSGESSRLPQSTSSPPSFAAEGNMQGARGGSDSASDAFCHLVRPHSQLPSSSSPAAFLSLLSIARAHSRLQPALRPQEPLLSQCLLEMLRHPSALTPVRFVALWRIFSSLSPRTAEDVAALRGRPRGPSAAGQSVEPPAEPEQPRSADAAAEASFYEASPHAGTRGEAGRAGVTALGRAAFGFLCQHSERMLSSCTISQLASVASSLLAYEPLLQAPSHTQGGPSSAYTAQATFIANGIRRRLLELYQMQARHGSEAAQAGDEADGGAPEAPRGNPDARTQTRVCNSSAGERENADQLLRAARKGAPAAEGLLERPQQAVWLLAVLGRFTPESAQYAALPLLTALCSGAANASHANDQARAGARDGTSFLADTDYEALHLSRRDAAAVDDLRPPFISPLVRALSAQEVAVLLRAMARLHLRHIRLLTQVCFHLSAALDGENAAIDGSAECRPSVHAEGDSTSVADVAHTAATPLASGRASAASLASLLLALAKLSFHPALLDAPTYSAGAPSRASSPHSVSRNAGSGGVFSRSGMSSEAPAEAAAFSWTAVMRELTSRCRRQLLGSLDAHPAAATLEGRASASGMLEQLPLSRYVADSEAASAPAAEGEVTLFTAVNALYAFALVDFADCYSACASRGGDAPPPADSATGEASAAPRGQTTSERRAHWPTRGGCGSLMSEAATALVAVCQRHLLGSATTRGTSLPNPAEEGDAKDMAGAAWPCESSLKLLAEKASAEMPRIELSRKSQGSVETFTQLIAVHAALDRLRAIPGGAGEDVGEPSGEERSTAAALNQTEELADLGQHTLLSPHAMAVLQMAREQGERGLRAGQAPAPATLATSAFHRQAMMALEAALSEEFLTEVPFLSGVFYIDCVLHERRPPVALEFDGPLHFYHPASFPRSNGSYGQDSGGGSDRQRALGGSLESQGGSRNDGVGSREEAETGRRPLTQRQPPAEGGGHGRRAEKDEGALQSRRAPPQKRMPYTSLSLFKQRLLERHGFRVVRIAYSDWLRLDGDLEKQKAFLIQAISSPLD
ncbi:hypothetical protein BESB_014140 [Besnoitia besnoiti]|uniref:RAP domain-containing protein n=1 Tax=Besnoitia besnoiti TaxID=94643 RepID=A0A2A9MBN5_BESBE|nr:hypothetical protein BESB_014140 [Besnoitia besnoiti]PFH32802.1 hypothetical protein BESB_014140 [Besnoitia besnoiti]